MKEGIGMLTAFGKFCRKLRIDSGELLRDMAEDVLDVTASYLSAVEIGKRTVPKKWIGILVDHYNLNEDQKVELQKAVDLSQKSIKVSIGDFGEGDKELMLSFARRFKELEEDDKDMIKSILNKKNYK